MMGPKPPLVAVASSRRSVASLLAVAVVVLVATVIGLSQPVVGAGGWLDFIATGGGTMPWTAAKDKYQDDYDQINELLVARVPTAAPLDNLVEAVRWSKQLVDGKGAEPADGKPLSHEQRRQMRSLRLKPVIQFTSLLKLMDSENIECGLHSYDILRHNELATGSQLMVPNDKDEPLRRIEDVIRRVAVMHAGECRFQYPRLLRWAQKNAAQPKLDNIRRMWNGIIDTCQMRIFENEGRTMDQRHLLRQKAQFISLKGREEAQAMLVYLRNRARHDPDARYLGRQSDPKRRGQWMVVVPKVAEMLNKYAIDMCEYFMRAFGHILKPAAYEEQLYTTETRHRAINDDHAELIVNMEYYRLCDDLRSKYQSTMQKNVVQAIWDEVKS